MLIPHKACEGLEDVLGAQPAAKGRAFGAASHEACQACAVLFAVLFCA